ncbi:hypothetical protein LZ554_005109 [Drepanopeziza brunnea f. sp. 'monogermtubi']|nr:hypothetical protein LZ554_005109 [Drepanopeziza brunnea f. sp. 'monogermtubi']
MALVPSQLTQAFGLSSNSSTVVACNYRHSDTPQVRTPTRESYLRSITTSSNHPFDSVQQQGNNTLERQKETADESSINQSLVLPLRPGADANANEDTPEGRDTAWAGASEAIEAIERALESELSNHETYSAEIPVLPFSVGKRALIGSKAATGPRSSQRRHKSKIVTPECPRFRKSYAKMSTSSGTPESWISSFCSLLGHEYFAEISEDFIEDDFNLTGLQTQVAMYKEALEMILDVEPEDEEDEENEDEDEELDDSIEGEERSNRRAAAERRHHRMASDLSIIESSAEMLYGLIHQRFICSRAGIQQMSEKYELTHFGVCPRTHCGGTRTLPVGLSDVPGEDTVKLFCPSCLDVYVPPNSRFQTVDGAFFGRTFGALFLMTFPDYDLSKKGESISGSHNSRALQAADNDDKEKINGMSASNLAPGLGPGNMYEPKIYGFRVSERARSGPRMSWLRDRPTDVTELDEAAMFHADHPDDSEEDDTIGVQPRPRQQNRKTRRANGGGSPMDIEPNGAAFN